MCCFTCPPCRTTAGCRSAPLDEMIAGRARRGRALQARCARISCCGSPRSRASQRGPRRGATGPAAPAGTSSARRCRRRCSARPSTSTAAASISCFRIMRTRSRNRAARFIPPVMANYWMHNGFLQVEGEKMAKSAGNFVTIHELVKDWPGEVLRSEYAAHALPSADRLDGEKSWKKAERRSTNGTRRRQPSGRHRSQSELNEPSHSVLDALLDDLNTPKAIAELHQSEKLGGARARKRKRFLA